MSTKSSNSPTHRTTGAKNRDTTLPVSPKESDRVPGAHTKSHNTHTPDEKAFAQHRSDIAIRQSGGTPGIKKEGQG